MAAEDAAGAGPGEAWSSILPPPPPWIGHLVFLGIMSFAVHSWRWMCVSGGGGGQGYGHPART